MQIVEGGRSLTGYVAMATEVIEDLGKLGFVL